MEYEVKEIVTNINYENYKQREMDNAPANYKELKGKHPDTILLFRFGDFYETYCDDAQICSAVLGITLTISSKGGFRMAGFPYHALDTYLPKLIRAGKRIAICDQLEESKPKNN